MQVYRRHCDINYDKCITNSDAGAIRTDSLPCSFQYHIKTLTNTTIFQELNTS